MKKLTLFLVAFLGISLIGFSQVKKPVQTATIKVPGLHCESCKQRVEDYMVREPGVSKVTADFKRKTVKVTFMTERTNIENLKTGIANLGYDADDVKANPEAQARLPKACRPPQQ
jgi:periplasmic mercuric ion binding protein